MKQLERALRSHEIGPMKGDTTRLFMRTKTKVAWVRGRSQSQEGGEGKNGKLGVSMVKKKPETLEGDD